MIQRLQKVAFRPAAAVVITALTVLIAGGVILTSTSIGCGPAQKLGLKGVASHCKSSAVAGITHTPPPAPYSAAPYTPPASSPYNPPASAPYNPPASGPYYPPASGPYPPYGGPATGSYPPFVPPATGGGPPSYSLNCRLPVYNGPPGSGGFVVYPGGAYIADPTSSVVIPTPSPGSPPPQPNYGPGYTGLSYDFAYHKWLPVPFTQVSPDGSRYVHVSTDSIYLESVVNGSTTELGEGHSWQLVSVENTGVYAEISNQPGLWLLPFSGAAAQITSSGFWQLETRGAAYGTAASALPGGVANTILRLDVTTHAITDWFTREGGSSSVFGADANGNLIVSVNYFAGGSEAWLVTGSKTGLTLFGSPEFLNSYSTPVGDSHGIWFVLNYQGYPNVQGLALYVPGSGLYWMSTLGTTLAGGCN